MSGKPALDFLTPIQRSKVKAIHEYVRHLDASEDKWDFYEAIEHLLGVVDSEIQSYGGNSSPPPDHRHCGIQLRARVKVVADWCADHSAHHGQPAIPEAIAQRIYEALDPPDREVVP